MSAGGRDFEHESSHKNLDLYLLRGVYLRIYKVLIDLKLYFER